MRYLLLFYTHTSPPTNTQILFFPLTAALNPSCSQPCQAFGRQTSTKCYPAWARTLFSSLGSPNSATNASSEFICALCMIFCCPINAEEFLCGAKVLPDLPTPHRHFWGKAVNLCLAKISPLVFADTRQRFSQ